MLTYTRGLQAFSTSNYTFQRQQGNGSYPAFVHNCRFSGAKNILADVETTPLSRN
jgi:hypothetical protein